MPFELDYHVFLTVITYVLGLVTWMSYPMFGITLTPHYAATSFFLLLSPHFSPSLNLYRPDPINITMPPASMNSTPVTTMNSTIIRITALISLKIISIVLALSMVPNHQTVPITMLLQQCLLLDCRLHLNHKILLRLMLGLRSMFPGEIEIILRQNFLDYQRWDYLSTRGS